MNAVAFYLLIVVFHLVPSKAGQFTLTSPEGREITAVRAEDASWNVANEGHSFNLRKKRDQPSTLFMKSDGQEMTPIDLNELWLKDIDWAKVEELPIGDGIILKIRRTKTGVEFDYGMPPGDFDTWKLTWK